MGFLKGLFKALKLPVKFLNGWLKKKPKLSQKEKNLRAYARNFPPVASKNISYQKSDRKNKKGKKNFPNKKIVR